MRNLKTKMAIVCIFMVVALLALSLVHLNPAFAVQIPSPSWRAKDGMPTARSQLAVVAGDDGLIYAMGGWDGGSEMNTVEAYDPLTGTWSTKAHMLNATRGAASAKGVDGTIYVIGGAIGSTINATQAYNTTSNSWSMKAQIPVRVWMASAAAGKDGKIYVFGGSPAGSSGSISNKTQIYDPATNTWVNGTDIPIAVAEQGAVKGPDGLIYNIGGHNGTSTISAVQAYNPATDSWMIKPSMPIAKLQFGLTLGPDSKIYVIGGGTMFYNDYPPFLDTIEIYDTRTGTWTEPVWSESFLSTPRKELGAALGMNGRIYAVGGGNGPYLDTNEEGIITMPENITPMAYIDSITPNPVTVNDSIMLVGHGTDPDGSIVGYKWRSSVNGTIGTAATFNVTTLSSGTHTIYFSVQDNSGAWSPEVTATVTVNKPLADDPLYQKLLDLNAQIGNLREQNANLTDTTSDLTKKVDMLTMELLGTSAVTIILVLALIAVVFMNKRKPPPATSPAA